MATKENSVFDIFGSASGSPDKVALDLGGPQSAAAPGGTFNFTNKLFNVDQVVALKTAGLITDKALASLIGGLSSEAMIQLAQAGDISEIAWKSLVAGFVPVPAFPVTTGEIIEYRDEVSCPAATLTVAAYTDVVQKSSLVSFNMTIPDTRRLRGCETIPTWKTGITIPGGVKYARFVTYCQETASPPAGKRTYLVTAEVVYDVLVTAAIAAGDLVGIIQVESYPVSGYAIKK